LSTLIAYASKHGCTKKLAEKLSEMVTGDTKLVNLDDNASPDLSPYDTIIAGGPIYAGRIRKSVRDFCENNLPQLSRKRLGLFICCLHQDEKAEEELGTSFPDQLLSKAVASGWFGGEIDFKKLGFFERLITQKVAKITGSEYRISEEQIARFVSAINNGKGKH